jgi:hypothetical protein
VQLIGKFAGMYYRECLASHTERLLVVEDRFALLAITELLLTLLNKHTLNWGSSHSSFTVSVITLTFCELPSNVMSLCASQPVLLAVYTTVPRAYLDHKYRFLTTIKQDQRHHQVRVIFSYWDSPHSTHAFSTPDLPEPSKRLSVRRRNGVYIWS